MDEDAVFRRYDIRGKVPEEIDTEFAELLGRAVGTFVAENYSSRITVCRDNKDTSTELKQALMKGLKATGTTVLDAGTGPTDYAAFKGRENGTVTVQVTSSHLPLDTNGFKLMYPEGNGFLNEDLDQVEKIFRSREFQEGEGKTEKKLLKEEYMEAAENFVGEKIDGKIVVDTLGGATSGFLPELLERLGAEVIDLAAEKGAEQPYVDPPNPEPERLEELKQRVEEGADLGVATDMDGDRVTVYSGRWISGDELFAELVEHLQTEKIVASIDTSSIVKDAVEKNGGEIIHTRVGDPFVIDAVLDNDAEIGGEPNGHYCFPGFVPYNSGTMTAALVAAKIESFEGLPENYTETASVETCRQKQVMEELKDLDYPVISTIDGIKFDTGETTVLVRPSGTSPKIRIKVDGKNRKEVEERLEEFLGIVRNQ